jgi:flagellin
LYSIAEPLSRILHIIANWGKKLHEFKNVLDVTYGSYVVNGAYGGVNNSNGSSTQAPVHNQVVADIRELLTGDTAAIRWSDGDASTAVSTIQILTDSIETLSEKLVKMLELAKNASNPGYSQGQIKDLKTHLQDLAKEINQIVNSTEYNFNKPFTADGKTLSIPIGNNSKIDIFAKDFSFDAQDLNITTDPQNALSTIEEAITNINEYKTYLDRQEARLGDITAAIESEIQAAMGVDLKDFQPELAAPMADYAASLVSQSKQTSLKTQANFTPDEILKLLEVKY